MTAPDNFKTFSNLGTAVISLDFLDTFPCAKTNFLCRENALTITMAFCLIFISYERRKVFPSIAVCSSGSKLLVDFTQLEKHFSNSLEFIREKTRLNVS